MELINVFINATEGYLNWLIGQISIASGSLYGNYFWFLGIISIFFFLLEVVIPWRKNQSVLRKDFWLDAFYMYFNFFIFYIILFAGLQETGDYLIQKLLKGIGIENKFAIQVQKLNLFWKSLIALIVQDFTHWNVHRLLHRVPILWKFHKVHHSVKEMGFAAHLRYHWMEPVVYNSLKYIPLAIIGGFSAQDVAFVHFFNIAIGHLNHANINWNFGWLKYVLNNPRMHIWHHSKELPEERKYGVNFGLTLSIWDYIFKTNYVPYSGRDIELGFKGDEDFPKGFIQQEIYPLGKR